MTIRTVGELTIKIALRYSPVENVGEYVHQLIKGAEPLRGAPDQQSGRVVSHIPSPACTPLTLRKCYFFSFFLDNQERDGDESDVSHDSKNGVSDTANMPVCSKDTIFISGLPTTMSKQCLFDTLLKVFITCGDIKVSEREIL